MEIIVKLFLIFSLLIAFIFELNLSFTSILYNNKQYIFTFWEPRGKIPGYLNLCIKTWTKFLPEYIVIILDYNKAKEYLGETLFSNIISE